MAKQQKNDADEIKKLISDIYKIVQVTSAQSKEQVNINRELLKVMALLQTGFAKNEEDARKLIDDVNEGLELQDKYAIKWAKARKAEQKDVERLIKKFREIEQITDQEIENAEDYLDLFRDRYDLLEGEFDISKQLLSTHKQILKIISDNKHIYEKIGGSALNLDDTLEKIASKKIDFDSLFDGFNSSIDAASDFLHVLQDDFNSIISNVSGVGFDMPIRFNPITGDIDKELQNILNNLDAEKKQRINGLREYFQLNSKLQSDMSRNLASNLSGLNFKIDVDTGDLFDGIKKITKGTKEYGRIIEQLDQIAIDKNVFNSITESFESISDLLSINGQLTDIQEDKLYQLLQPLGIANKILVKQLQTRLSDIEVNKTALLLESNKIKLLHKNIDLMKSTEKVVYRIGQGFDYISSVLPFGIGDMMGLSRVSDNLLASHKQGIEAITKKLIEGGSRAEALQGYYKAMIPQLKSIITPWNAIIVAGALLYKYVSGITEKLSAMSNEYQISLAQSHKLLDSNLDVLTVTNNQFATLKDIENVQSELIGSSGKYYSAIQNGNSDMILQITDMGKAFGYGAAEATKIYKVFSDLGASDELSLNLQANLGLMSEMAGLSPQIIGKDLIDSSEIVYTYFAGLPEKAAQAALNVRRMGMSLKQAGSIAQKMLNLDGFMTDMYELYAMSGRGIDFSQAFDKGLMGDIEGMTKSIMESIGDTARFNQMDYLTRMKIANTLGMSMDELSKSVKMHEQISQFSGKERDILDANIDRMGDISKLNKDEIRDRLKQLQSTDRLTIAWDKIKGVLIKSLLPLVETFAAGIDAIMPLIDFIVGGLKIVGNLLKPVAILLKGFLFPLRLMGKAIEFVNEKLFENKDVIGLINVATTALSIPFKVIGKVIEFISEKVFGVKTEISGVESTLKSLSNPLEIIGGIIGTWFFTKKAMSFFGLIKSESNGLKSIIPSIFSDMFSRKPIQPISIDNIKSAKREIINSGKEIDVVKRKSNGIFSKLGASESFGTVRDIATKTLSMIVIDNAKKMMGFGKNIEDGIAANQNGIESAMSGAFSVGGLLLSGYLDQAIGKVFEKKLEKKFTKGLEPLSGKAKTVFGKIGDLAKNVFPSAGKILDFGMEKINPPKNVPEISTDTPKIDTPKPKISKNIDETTINTKKTIKSTIDTKNVNKSADVFTKLSDTIKIVWKNVKGILTEMLDFSMQILTKLSKGIGQSINNLLSGIASGLNKFKTNAVKGAASLVLVSGSIWILSKSLQNFANIGWEDISKGMVAIGGLVAVSMLLGKSSGSMIKGAIAIALLGASLIPAAIAFAKFNDVNWSSMGKAAVAIIELGLAAAVLGPSIPIMAAGAISIALLGAALIPAAIAFKKFNDVDWSSLGKAAVAIAGLSIIASVITPMLPVLIPASLGIAAFAASLIPLSMALNNFKSIDIKPIISQIGDLSNITKPILKLSLLSPIILAVSVSLFTLTTTLSATANSVDVFNSNISKIDISKIETTKQSLSGLADINVDGLYNLSSGIKSLSGSFAMLSLSSAIDNILPSNTIKQLIQISSLSDPILQISDAVYKLNQYLNELGKTAENIELNKINIDGKVDYEYPKPVAINDNLKIQQSNIVNTLPPSKTSTAQNYNVEKIIEKQNTLHVERQQMMQDELEYNTDALQTINLKNVEQLLQQLINIVANKPSTTQLNMDGYAVNNVLKKFNNK